MLWLPVALCASIPAGNQLTPGDDGLPVAASGYEFKDRSFYPASTTVTVFGQKLHVWQQKCIVCDSLLRTGVWEPTLTDVVHLALGAVKQPALVDVGANVGYYSVLAAAAGASVFAVEAFDKNAFLLRETLATNSIRSVHLVEKAVAQPGAAGRACIRGTNAATNSDNGFLAQDGECLYRPRLTTLDAALRDEFPGWAQKPVTLLKMDIEASEMPALAGAKELFADPARKPCAVVIEYTFRTENPPREKFCQLLGEYGYTPMAPGPTDTQACSNGDWVGVATPAGRADCADVAQRLRQRIWGPKAR